MDHAIRTAALLLLLLMLIITQSSSWCQAFSFGTQQHNIIICPINNRHQFRYHWQYRNYFSSYPEGERKQSCICMKTPLEGNNNDFNKNRNTDTDGSVLGASLLYAGTAIGAGAIAMPAETVAAGFVPSTVGLILCWIFTFVTSMLTLEASWLASSSIASDNRTGVVDGGSFLSISKMSLGLPGEIITSSLFWFLLTAILVAYTAEGGQLISKFIQEALVASTDENTVIPPAIGSFLFAAFFATLANVGTARVDAINRIFVTGLIVTFVCLVGACLPLVQVSNLLSQSDWSKLYPPVISIGILSLGAQNVVPTLLQYLKNDPIKTRQAILIGSLVPLILYLTWEAIFLGSVDVSQLDKSNDVDVMSMLLGQFDGSVSTVVSDLIEGFSFCAVGSSMAGASVSLVDFFQDGVAILFKEHDQSSKNEEMMWEGESRIVATALALGPPCILAYAFPNIFLVALENAGLLGGVSLYGILPATSILALKYYSSSDNLHGHAGAMPGRLGGGDVSRMALVVISLSLIIPEIINLM